MGEPHFAEDEGTYFYNKERDLILKFDEYQDMVNVNLFKNYPETLDDEMTTEQPSLESPQQEFKTLKDPIYGGDIIKIGPFGPVGTPGETSWVAAEIKPLLGGGGFAPYEENGQLPQQVFKPLDKVVHTADLSFWLEPVDDSSLMIMSGEYAQFYLCVRVAPKPRYDSYYFSVNLMFLTQGSRQKLPINKMDNIEIKISNS